MLVGRTETAYASKYVALRPLAMGGMAEILLARVKGASPERLVVLKRLHRHLAVDRDYVQMFMDEARLATTLRHSNVVEVYELGEDADHYYLVMEYLHGHDLRRVLSEMAMRSVSVRLSHALTIIAGVCRGLDYTHERTNANGELLGIVHRDVSPHNVLLTFNGGVKLLDFGIAKTSSQMSRTRTGILKGKVAYMSPEQAMGEELDRRSDVFCIGILLWEMTTGQWLYRRKSELETLKAVVDTDAPMPSQVHPGYPRELEQIVMKTLARKRDDRWATAGELADAITAFGSRQRLNLAPAMLARMMSSLFSEDVAAWQDARRAGATLGDHLVAELEREDRRAAALRKSSGDQGGERSASSENPTAALANAAFFSRHISVDDFDSPTVDHSPDELLQPDNSELEDEPTTVHTPQRSARWAEQITGTRPSAESPAQPSSPELRPGQGQTTEPRPRSPRKQKPTEIVRTLSSQHGSAQGVLRRWKEAVRWLMQERVPRRWIWLAVTGGLAVLAAIWLVATLLHRDAEPASAPAAPSSQTSVPARPSPAASAAHLPPGAPISAPISASAPAASASASPSAASPSAASPSAASPSAASPSAASPSAASPSAASTPADVHAQSAATPVPSAGIAPSAAPSATSGAAEAGGPPRSTASRSRSAKQAASRARVKEPAADAKEASAASGEPGSAPVLTDRDPAAAAVSGHDAAPAKSSASDHDAAPAGRGGPGAGEAPGGRDGGDSRDGRDGRDRVTDPGAPAKPSP